MNGSGPQGPSLPDQAVVSFCDIINMSGAMIHMKLWENPPGCLKNWASVDASVSKSTKLAKSLLHAQ